MESRSQRARRLARRVDRRTPPSRRPLGWALLGAAWLHLAVFAVLAVTPHVGPRFERLPPFAPPEPAVAEVDPPRPYGPGATARAEHLDVVRIAPTPSRRFARTSADEAAEAPPEDPVAIGAHDVLADRLQVAPVTSDRPGLPTPISDGEGDLPASPSLERLPGDPDAALGNRADGQEGVANRGGGGGGRLGEGRGPGSPGEGDGVASGGPARGGGGAHDGAPAGSGTDDSDGAPLAPEGQRAPGATPSWWDPLAVRTGGEPGADGPIAEVPSTGDASSSGVAALTRPGRRASTGGVRLPEGDREPLPGPPSEIVGTRHIAAPGTADPVDELRLALGFGPLDRAKLAPRPEWAGRLYDAGMADSSPQTAFDDASIAWRTSVATEGTALGTYVQEAEDLIAVRWRGADLEPHARAIGVQGDVTVRYVVRPDGRTSEVRVVRSSGNAALDELAVHAIPERLPRFPRTLPREPFAHEITLRYRNPLIGP